MQPQSAGAPLQKSEEETLVLRQFLAAIWQRFSENGFTGFLAGLANTNLREYDARMVLRIWAVGIRLLSDQVKVYVNPSGDDQEALASLDLVPTMEGISVGIFEFDLVSLGLGNLEAGSYTVFLKVGDALWWPWNPC